MYIGNHPVNGDSNNSFKVLDDITSYTLTFNGSSASLVSVANDTITNNSHRFITGQRVTYNTTGTAIVGLTAGTAYFIIKEDQNTVKLALTQSDAINNIAINFTALGTGSTHTLNIAFDGVNTKFKATYDNGTKSQITRAAQLTLSVNGVIQQPQDTASPTTGFGIDFDSVIVFSVAPLVTDVFWGNLVANNFPTFDIADNTVDSFTGDGTTTSFTLSKEPANNQNILVTLDGVVQYPSDAFVTRAYSVISNVITFQGAPGNATDIQVRHIGFAGATSSAVTGFYGRTGNVGLTTADHITVGSLVISGIMTAASFSGTATSTTNIPNLTGAITSSNTATSLGSFSSSDLRTALTDETGSGSAVFATSPTLVTPVLGNASATSINVAGVSTLGNTVVGGGTTQLIVTGDARITGILTIGTSSITLDGSNNQVNVGTGVTIHHTNGVQVGGNTLHSTGLTVNSLNASGVITATSFSGSGANLTGIAVTENVRTDSLVVSGITTATGGIQVGATTSITVGNTFIKNNVVGLGTTTTTGRNAGVSTATGSLIYNSTKGEVQVYKGNEWKDVVTRDFIEATGGVISDYNDPGPGAVYRAHVFTSSGSFDVTAAPVTSNTVEYLVVAGGGGGGGSTGPGDGPGGGGAGGFRTGTGLPVSTSPGVYSVTVGSGGVGGNNSAYNAGISGSPSIFSTITSTGGGGGGAGPSGTAPGGAGGSGGGTGYQGTAGSGNTPPVSPPQGNPGGTSNSSPPFAGSGGGGSGGAGSGAPSGSQGGAGGSGSSNVYAYGPANPVTYAGGGGGGGGFKLGSNTGGSGGPGGGGAGGSYPGTSVGTPGTYATGGGGGGSAGDFGGSGGSGIVVVRYQIGSLAATAKATGGLISYYDNKTIHTFLGSGTFNVTSGPISGETLIVAGGGGAGYYGGGGGAGGLLWYGSPTPTKTANGSAIAYTNGVTYSISVGGGGASVGPYSVTPKQGNSGTATVLTHPSGPYSATEGGGGGGNDPASNPVHTGLPGGSGGGASNQNASGSPGPGVSGQGFAGGTATGSGNPNQAGGGGGAGGAGTAGGSGSHGGIGLQFSTFGAIGAGAPGPGGGTGWFAGGGAGGGGTPFPGGFGGGPGGPYAGGGDSNTPSAPKNGRQSTGGGGGSTRNPGVPGSGGAGIVIIAYPS